MKRIDSILRAIFSTLNERAAADPFARTTSSPTFNPQTESASSTLYTTGVLVSDFVSSIFLYSLILALRNLDKVPGVTRKCDQSSSNAHRVSLSR